MIPRVTVTDKAIALIEKLKAMHGPLLFHQSGGCCDGSQPMCFAAGEFKISEDNDVKLGDVHDCPFYMGKDQYTYWAHTQLQVDAAPGRGSSFSLEIPLGYRFIIRSRLFTEDELALLKEN